MNTLQEYKCSACNEIYDFYSINKHLQICEKYDNWIENYVPPKTEPCDICNLNFIDNIYLEKHKINCKKNNI